MARSSRQKINMETKDLNNTQIKINVTDIYITLLTAAEDILLKHTGNIFQDRSCQSISSVAQSCLSLGDPVNRSTPGLLFHHQLLGFIQTHVPQVSDAIQPSHPHSSPSPPAPNPSQHQSISLSKFRNTEIISISSLIMWHETKN